VSNLQACGDTDASANVRMNVAYAYDRVKNITTIADRLRQERMSYAYDELDRLTEWKQETPYGSSTYVTQESYAYDKIGNIMSKTGVGNYTYLDGKPHAVTHINGLRVASYDPNGNMTTRTESATYAQLFDIQNRLTDVNGVHFVYDADGTLIKKVEGSKTTTYIGNYFEKEQAVVFVPNTQKSFGANWKIENFALPGGKTRKYYYFGGQRVAVRESNAAPQWIHGDHLGSASITTDNAGAKVGEMRYTPFGEYRVDLGDAKGNKRFQGAERVESIGLDSMGARFYSPRLGRFISADTIVPGIGNPQIFNRYSFVLNNPLKLTDPSGHDPNDSKKCETYNYDCSYRNPTPLFQFFGSPVTGEPIQGYGATVFAKDNWPRYYKSFGGLHSGWDFNAEKGDEVKARVEGTIYGFNQFGDELPNVVIIPSEFGIGQDAIDAFNRGAALAIGFSNTEGDLSLFHRGDFIAINSIIGHINNLENNQHLHLSVYQQDPSGFIIYNPIQFFPSAVQNSMSEKAKSYKGGYAPSESPSSMRQFHTTPRDGPVYWNLSIDQAVKLIQIVR